MIPLYVRAWDIVFSFAPCMLNSSGMLRSSSSWICFSAPALARLLLSSFPCILLCPLTHVKVVGADHLLVGRLPSGVDWHFLFLSSLGLPSFVGVLSVLLLCILSLIMISNGWKCCTPLIAAIIVATSPTWFDCIFPGTLNAWFLWSSGPNHMPTPHLVLAFPLWKHAPSMYTFISSCLSLVPMSMNLCTGFAVDFSGSVNIWKQSLILFLLVRVGSKIIDPPSSSAFLFCSFLWWVRDSCRDSECRSAGAEQTFCVDNTQSPT